MANCSPFAEKAGMRKVAEQRTIKSLSSVSKMLLELSFDLQLLGSERYVSYKLGNLTTKQLEVLKEAFAKCGHPRFKKEVAGNRRRPFGDLTGYRRCMMDAVLSKLVKLVKIVGLLSQTKIYLFWSRL